MTTRSLAALRLVVFLTACGSSGNAIRGPGLPSADSIVEVELQGLSTEHADVRDISDPKIVRGIAESAAISSDGWLEDSSERQPLYRIAFVLRDGNSIVYWLGANSHPARFPCYSLCSGWWLAASRGHSMDDTRYKPLAESLYMPFLAKLGLP